MILFLPSIFLLLAAAGLFTSSLKRFFPESSFVDFRKISAKVHSLALTPEFQTRWFAAFAGASAAWGSILLWQSTLPFFFTFSLGERISLFLHPLTFLVDSISWVYALSLATLALGTTLTALASDSFFDDTACGGILLIVALGIFATLAGNPITLALFWAALDLVELIARLHAVHTPELRERAIVAFFMRVLGMSILLWAGIIGIAKGGDITFTDAPARMQIWMLLAAGIRLGTLPPHLPFPHDSELKREYGVILQLVSAASSLVLFARASRGGIDMPYAILLFLLGAVSAFYGGWRWLRARNLEEARPYWILGMGALSLITALFQNPEGSAAWGVFLLLSGGMLFLTSLDHKWLKRLSVLTLASGAALPFTLTATGWEGNHESIGIFWVLLLIPHIFLLAGYVRYAARSSFSPFTAKRKSAQLTYILGILLFPLTLFTLGIWGWSGAKNIGIWQAPIATLLLGVLFWQRRIRLLTRLRGIQITRQIRWGGLERMVWGLYYFLRKLSETVSAVLESDGGILWTLVFLILFISLAVGGAGK